MHAVIVSGVCNEKAVFMDVNIGQPGRMHDARVFRLSPLYERLMDPNNALLPEDKHLIGDSAYPLLINLMTPYKDNGHLTHERQIYNTKLSTVRSTIERAFGLLKGKFRRLKYIDVAQPEAAIQIVGVACILHNFIILQNNADDDYNVENGRLENEPHEEEQGLLENERGVAETKRQNLVNRAYIQ